MARFFSSSLSRPTTARDLMEGQPDADVNWLGCHFEVVNEAGEIVFELPFSEVVELRPKPN